MEKVKFFDSPIKILGGSIIIVEAILAAILGLSDLTETATLWIVIGMVVSLILAIIGAVIMHWMNTRVVTAPSSSNDQDPEYDIFISFPIAGVRNITEREEINSFADSLEQKLKDVGYNKIFNPSFHFIRKKNAEKKKFQAPDIAAKLDLDAIVKSTNFLFIYPSKVPTSALIELGYAMHAQKNVIICAPNSNTLPFLARGFSQAFSNVTYVDYSDNDHLIDKLVQNNSIYFK